MKNAILKPKVKFTTERFYPDFKEKFGVQMTNRHIHRYEWASNMLKSSDRVLDAGCGSGSFDHILLEKCFSVHGIDKSREAIDYAKWLAQKNKRENLTYSVLDMEMVDQLARNGHRPFDAVVCIEAIEHMSSAGQLFFMDALKSVLKRDGLLLMTTPERGTATGDHHRCEFRRDKFFYFLSKFYHDVRFDRPDDFGIPKNFMLACCTRRKADEDVW